MEAYRTSNTATVASQIQAPLLHGYLEQHDENYPRRVNDVHFIILIRCGLSVRDGGL